MKWFYVNGSWSNTNNELGTPPGLPAQHPQGRNWKNGDSYEDGAIDDPLGYTKKTVCGRSIWLKDDLGLLDGEDVALDHLITGAHENRKKWHLDKEIKGTGLTGKEYYLHPGKSNGALYLIDQRADTPTATHDDGVPMIEVLKEGKVSDNVHKF